jgi:hypothetical protein
LVVVDGKEQKQYDGTGSLVFSPDSKHVAYAAKADNKWFVVVDGKEGKSYDELVTQASIIFDSPESLHFLVLAGNNVYLAEMRLR